MTSDRQNFRSQYQQDELVDRAILRGLRNGVFVDIGAHDGVSYSNSLHFERDLGWTGLCIEANPRVYPKLAASRAATSMNVAVADREGTMPFYAVSGPGEMLSGLVSASANWHLAGINRAVERDGGSLRTIDVPTKRLDDILASHSISEIHYLSIDTEGNEPDILRTIDHTKVMVHVIGVECNKRGDLPELINAAGPTFKFLMRHYTDAFFINRTSPLTRRRHNLRLYSLGISIRRKLRRAGIMAT